MKPFRNALRIDILTLFPRMFDSYFSESILKRAQTGGRLSIGIHDIRAFTEDRHHTADAPPYGGGPGMVLKVQPIYKAVEAAKRTARGVERRRVILFSTRGTKLNAAMARRLAKYHQLILICGRYEGVDERVAEHIADEEVSVGDFVLSGGELAAMMLTEAIARFVPGVLGKQESLEEEKGSYPVYTRPETFRRWRVPKVLLSGNHKKIEAWRRAHY